MNNREVASEWFEFAKRDLKSAEFLIDMHPRPIEIICYHCQQCAEKYLKGYIDDECIELVIYGVQVRYPYELEIND